jgi:hypothetical protein
MRRHDALPTVVSLLPISTKSNGIPLAMNPSTSIWKHIAMPDTVPLRLGLKAGPINSGTPLLETRSQV